MPPSQSFERFDDTSTWLKRASSLPERAIGEYEHPLQFGVQCLNNGALCAQLNYRKDYGVFMFKVKAWRVKDMGEKMLRRTFLKGSTLALGAAAAGRLQATDSTATEERDKSKVFFTTDLSVNGLLKIYSQINDGMSGKVAIKLHTGEPH